MPNSDTWPGRVAMESLSNMDSAGSCDSVISMNSGFSEDSMEHLSAEERACLMYLEETIEALEVQEDSGLSNDEPDSVFSNFKSGDSRIVLQSVPGSEQDAAQVDGGATFASTAAAESVGVSAEPEARELSHVHKTEHQASDETSEQQILPASAANTNDPEMSITQPKRPVSDSATKCINPTADTTTEALCTTGGDAESVPPNIQRCPVQSANTSSELDVGLIPPPSDFRDEPAPPTHPEKEEVCPPPAKTLNKKPVTTIDLELLRQRASSKRSPVSSLLTQDLPNKPPSELSAASLISPPSEAVEPRSPPAVAPKPKQLPANIILKSHKASVGGSDGSLGHSAPNSADRLLLDPQRVRIEALRKLGLLKSEEADLGPGLSLNLSPKNRRSWAASTSPLSPLSPHAPAPPSPSHRPVFSPPPPSAPVQSTATVVSPSVTSAAPPTLPPGILPAPAAFSDPAEPVPSHNELSAVKDVSQVTVIAQENALPPSPSILVKQLTPLKNVGVHLHSSEYSGLSQESSEGSKDISPNQSLVQLRNNRPRPASLGSGKEFSTAQGGGPQTSHSNGQNPDSRRSLPFHTAPQPSDNSQKLPRSQGISVLICPRSHNEEDRREALKKLGLFRD